MLEHLHLNVYHKMTEDHDFLLLYPKLNQYEKSTVFFIMKYMTNLSVSNKMGRFHGTTL